MKSEQVMSGLKANSCENAYYAMSTPLMMKCGVTNLKMTLQCGCKRVTSQSDGVLAPCLRQHQYKAISLTDGVI
jgi:hypothetical protein